MSGVLGFFMFKSFILSAAPIGDYPVDWDWSMHAEVGKPLDCYSVNLLTISIVKGGTKWVEDNGLMETSEITQTKGLNDKASTRIGGQRSIVLGCWVMSDIIKEKIQGYEQAYAKGKFKLNSLVKGSPFMDLKACKSNANAKPNIYWSSSYTVLATDNDNCNSKIKVTLADMEKEDTRLFRLKLSRTNKDSYVRQGEL